MIQNRIGHTLTEALTEALIKCMDELNTDNLCLLLAKAYHLLDEQEAQR